VQPAQQFFFVDRAGCEDKLTHMIISFGRVVGH